ncbi:MAG: ATP-binding protein [Thermoplasmatota archaeon]
MDDKELIDILIPFNFWKRKPYTGIPRPEYIDRIEKLSSSEQILVAKGVRRCGKTTILFQFLDHLIKDRNMDPKRTLYMNFEDPRLPIEEGTKLLDRVIKAHRALIDPKGLTYLVLDEVQRLSGWERWCRIHFDMKQQFRIIVSGSSSKLLSKELATLLTGRHIDLEVFPLNLSEYFRFNNLDPDSIMDPEVADALASEFISAPMFPQVALTKEQDVKEIMLHNIYRDIIEHDIARRYEIREIDKLESVANMVMSSVPGPVTITSVRKNMQNRISLDSVNRYFKYLQEPYLLFFVNTYSYKQKELERGPRKVYSIDGGLLQVVSHRFSANRGKLFENAVFLDLRREGYEIFRYKGRSEVDFLAWDRGGLISIINACLDISDENTKEREIKGLREVMKEYGRDTSFLVTLRENEEITVPEGSIKMVPYRQWALNLCRSL